MKGFYICFYHFVKGLQRIVGVHTFIAKERVVSWQDTRSLEAMIYLMFLNLSICFISKRVYCTFLNPLFFLGECAIGYVNEEEYIQRAQALIERLGIKQRSVSLTKRVLNQFKFLLKLLLIRTLWRV